MALLGTEGTWNREWLIWTLGSFSIENITVLAGAGNLPTGRMLGKITASGKYGIYVDDTATDGTQVAAGSAQRRTSMTVQDPSQVVASIADHPDYKQAIDGARAAGAADLAAYADQVTTLCVLAGQPDKISAYLTAKTPLAEVGAWARGERAKQLAGATITGTQPPEGPTKPKGLTLSAEALFAKRAQERDDVAAQNPIVRRIHALG